MEQMKLIIAIFLIVGLLTAPLTHAQSNQAASGGGHGSSTAMAAPQSKKAARAVDRALSKKILKALTRTKGLNGTRIFVKASDGDIALSGTVLETSQISLAIKTAQAVDGVKSVREALRLTTQPE
ncbi:BON domain-containing protein [Paraburkholderia sediminicola]|uniref:BON domain-containing protein n=1 Tax=Paraburkholderia sediminicola TaxID=458836 RepID=UPI000EAD3953